MKRIAKKIKTGLGASRQITLRVFILLSILGISFFSFYFAYFLTSSIYRKIIIRRTNLFADQISRQIYNSMVQLMRQGWTRGQLNEFLVSLNPAEGHLQYRIAIFRGRSVAQRFGILPEEAWGDNVKQVFIDGQIINFESDFQLTRLYPIKSVPECVRCHINSPNGDVLGVLGVAQDTKPMIEEAQGKFLLLALIFAPLPMILTLLISNFVNKRIKGSISLFKSKIQNVNRIKDLSKIDLRDLDHVGFFEFNLIIAEIRKFVEKVISIAMDKELLEFKMRMMEDFIVTSKAVKNSKEFMNNFLSEINSIIKVNNCFYLFWSVSGKEINDTDFEAQVFWHQKPEADSLEAFEKKFHETLRREVFDGNVDTPDKAKSAESLILKKVKKKTVLKHNLKKDGISSGMPLCGDNTHLLTKTLELADLGLFGIIGISIDPEIHKDSLRHLIARSALSMLLNISASVTAISAYTRELEYFATRDSLTDLFNQRMFWELSHYEIKRAGRHEYKFALLIIDVDNLKYLNDTYGHRFGDEFLKEISSAMKKVKRAGDILARYGGDEFAMILPQTEIEFSFYMATRIKDEVQKVSLLAPDGSLARGTISIGIAIYPDHAEDIKKLFLIADSMMYRAKEKGKNRVFFPEDAEISKILESYEMKNVMLSRVLADSDILLPFFQPIMRLDNRKVEMHELLMRINYNGEIVRAGNFFEAAEKMGISRDLERQLIEKTFRIIREQSYSGMLFINISPRDLLNRDYFSKILDLIALYQINKELLVFELTERDTVKNLASLSAFLQELKLTGLRFAIDDFGTGYSSYHYIKELPIDFIKIEGKFIQSILTDQVNNSLVRSIAKLAADLKIKTIAEYVENREILNFVQEFAIDFAQGYFICEPSPDLIHMPGDM